jgi:hypothetical protein
VREAGEHRHAPHEHPHPHRVLEPPQARQADQEQREGGYGEDDRGGAYAEGVDQGPNAKSAHKHRGD